MFFFSDHHILVTILFTPLAGAFVLLFVPGIRADLQRKIANCFGMLGFAVSLPLWWKFKSNSAEPFQFVCDANWIPSLDVHFRLGIDGISLPISRQRDGAHDIADFQEPPYALGVARSEYVYLKSERPGHGGAALQFLEARFGRGDR